MSDNENQLDVTTDDKPTEKRWFGCIFSAIYAVSNAFSSRWTKIKNWFSGFNKQQKKSLPEPQKKTSDDFQQPSTESELNVSVLKAVSTENLNGEVIGQPKATNVVCMVDFDDTLAGFDYTLDLSEYERILFGGENTVNEIKTLKETKGVSLCIVTRKNHEGATEAIQFLEDKKIAQYFDFVVFEKCKDHKTAMLNACKAYYNQSLPIDVSGDKKTIRYFLMDDSQDNCNAAKNLEIVAIHVKTDETKNAQFNGNKVLKSFETLSEKLNSLTGSSEASQGRGMQPSN